jgi:hypothetical protein
MNKIIVTFLALLMSSQLMAQKNINNTLTSNHVYIKGTKISLIPPKDFISSNNFQGLEHSESGSTIMIVEIPAGFSEISKGITKESLSQNGVTVENIENLTFNHLPALLVTGTQSANGSDFTKYILIFGTEKESVILNGVFPKNYTRAGDEIKKSILTAYYNPDQTISAFDILNYTINVDSTKLKFAKFFSNSLIYTIDGQLPTLSEDKTNLIVSRSVYKITTEDKEQFAAYRLGQMPYDIKSITSKLPITLDQLSGFEIIADGINKSTQVEEHLYQVILFESDFYYIFFGTTNDLSGKSIQQIKNAVRTFKLK